MSDFLFDEFSSVSSKQWKQKIQFDLKGADYNGTLLTHTNDGITIKPFYHKDEMESLEIPNTPTSFNICQTIFVSTEKTANYLALDALKRGADSIQFLSDTPFEIKPLLVNIPKSTEIHFQLNFLSESFITDLASYLKNFNSFLRSEERRVGKEC